MWVSFPQCKHSFPKFRYSTFGKDTIPVLMERQSQSPPMFQIIQVLAMSYFLFSRNYALEELMKQWPKQWKYLTLTPCRFSPKHRGMLLILLRGKNPGKWCQGVQVEISEGRRCTRKEGTETQWSHTNWHQWEQLFSWGPSVSSQQGPQLCRTYQGQSERNFILRMHFQLSSTWSTELHLISS